MSLMKFCTLSYTRFNTGLRFAEVVHRGDGLVPSVQFAAAVQQVADEVAGRQLHV